jgi:hypothetical protein
LESRRPGDVLLGQCSVPRHGSCSLAAEQALNHRKKANVLSGTGTALVNRRRVALKSGTLLLVEHKDRHEIKCTGRASLRTLNFYVPPGYSKDGEELAAAKV